MASRKALLVGINAYPTAPLGGCINDVVDLADHLQSVEGFDPASIRLITDARATKAAILEGLAWLLRDAGKDDLRVFHFSGHGVQLPTYDASKEIDGYDECICPVDFDWTDQHTLRDSELAKIFSEMAKGVRLVWISDSCHSGDLQRALRHPSERVRTIAPPMDIAWALAAARSRTAVERKKAQFRGVLLAACRSDQTAADASMGPSQRGNGAFTYYLLEAMRGAPRASAKQLVADTRRALASARFSQVPQGEGEAAALSSPLWPARAGGSGGKSNVGARALEGAVAVATREGHDVRMDSRASTSGRTELVLSLGPAAHSPKWIQVFTDSEAELLAVGGPLRVDEHERRRLTELDIAPARTVRVSLWSAGPSGFGTLLASRSYRAEEVAGKRLEFVVDTD